MKRTILVLLLVSAAANHLQAQGSVYLNNYDSRMGVYISDMLPAPVGTFVEILGGASATSRVPLLNSSGQGSVFTIEGAGVNALGPGTGSYFSAGSASVPGVAAGGLAWFELRAWLGGPSWDYRTVAGLMYWSQTIGTANNPAPLMMPYPLYFALPEPSPTALAALALAIFGLRRWHKRSWNTASK